MGFVAVVVALATAGTPTLGRQWAPNQKGYGRVAPRTIFGGGDPTGLVEHVRWRHWGARRAIGNGIGNWVWPGLGVADGIVRTRAVVVAYDLGPCRGKRAYRKIQWYFPKYGGVFDRYNADDICTGALGPSRPYRKCGAVRLRSPAGRASHIEAAGVSCPRARAILAGSPSARYVRRRGRFRAAGLYCGSEGNRGGIPPLFECARGRVDIFYGVTA
jgi:hypothetical protein